MIESPKSRVIAISLITAVCLLGDSMLYIVLPLHMKEAGLISLIEVGFLLSANRLIRIPLNPLIGFIYTKINTRDGILLASLLSITTTFSYAYIKGFWIWLIFRCLWGLAWTFLRLGAYFSILEAAGKNNRGYFTGLYNGLYRLGSLGGMLVGGILVDQYNIAVTACVLGGFTLFSIPLTYLFVSKQKIKSDTSNHVRFIFSKPILGTLITGLLLTLIYQGIFASTLSNLVQAHLSNISLFYLTIGATSIAGVLQAIRWATEPWLAPAVGKLADKKQGIRYTLLVPLISAAILFYCATLNLPAYLWLSVMLLIQLTATSLTTGIDKIAYDVATTASSKTFLTLYSLSLDIGASIGPVLAFALTSKWGIHSVYLLMSSILMALFITWSVKTQAASQIG